MKRTFCYFSILLTTFTINAVALAEPTVHGLQMDKVTSDNIVVESEVIEGQTVLRTFRQGEENKPTLKKIIPAICDKIWLHPKAELVVCETEDRQYFQNIEILFQESN